MTSELSDEGQGGQIWLGWLGAAGEHVFYCYCYDTTMLRRYDATTLRHYNMPLRHNPEKEKSPYDHEQSHVIKPDAINEIALLFEIANLKSLDFFFLENELGIRSGIEIAPKVFFHNN